MIELFWGTVPFMSCQRVVGHPRLQLEIKREGRDTHRLERERVGLPLGPKHPDVLRRRYGLSGIA